MLTHLSAAIVSYNPDQGLVQLVSTLLTSGCPVTVIDNASTSGRTYLDRCVELGAVVHTRATNGGVAGALHDALTLPVLGSWWISFDQDSVIDDRFIGRAVSAIDAAPEDVAMIGPYISDVVHGHTIQGSANTGTADVPRIITSGAVCRVAALRAVGGFRPELFIDSVDYDLCMRLTREGWRIQVAPALQMWHRIGSTRTHQLLGRAVAVSHHSPDRQYYKYRNYLLLQRDGTFKADRPLAARTAVSLIIAPLKILLWEDSRKSKLTAVAAGIRDGMRGRSGSRADAARPLRKAGLRGKDT